MSRWMGVFWVGLGLFLLLSSWLGQSSFVLPHLNINLGWVVIALGIFRIWWWWKTEELPRRRRLEARAEQRQFNLEMSRALEEQAAAEASSDEIAETDKADKAAETAEAETADDPTPESDPKR